MDTIKDPSRGVINGPGLAWAKGRNAAPGAPGRFSAWTSGAKTGIGRALNPASVLCYTLGKGVLNEVYYPHEDIACIRECVFVVADGDSYFSDERLVMQVREETLAPGIPLYLLENRCREGNYTLTKEIFSDPERNTLLQRVELSTARPGLHLYVCLTPHLRNSGADNEGWIGNYKGDTMLFAASDGLVLAMACSAGWERASVGFIGVSDGYGDLRENKKLTSCYDYAGKGNVQMCAEVVSGDPMVVAIGYGHSPEEAAHQARSSLLDSYESMKDQYVREWGEWLDHLREKKATRARYLRESAAALRIAESRIFPGALIASLSVPWGQTQGVNGGLGYHLVWPRDLVESAWGFMALGAHDDAMRILNYLFTIQEEDGRWSQNLWLDGRPCLNKLQMDQVALPILLVHSFFGKGMIDQECWRRYLPGIRKATTFILENGPFTEEDRWEQQPGLSPFTLATEVAALAAAAELFDEHGDKALAEKCRIKADGWNAQIENWTYVRDTETAWSCGVNGYYVRINPVMAPVQEVKGRLITIKHHPEGDGELPVGEVVSVDALALVRFGLRSASDIRIRNTVKVIDAQLRRELPAGPCWRRFTKDGYGENDAGDPFTGIGTGRCWPLLTGERAHYEIAAGNYVEARRLFRAMEGFSYNGSLPEQVWDGEDIPGKGLFRGRYTSGAMPLTWAQAEYIKLAVSLRQRKVFDMPAAAVRRYGGRK